MNIERPNILIAIFDSLSELDVSALANRLPALSAFREESIYFPNTYTCSPESGPARASLFTGLDMAAHGVWTDGVALPDREKTFPERFAECGYETFLIGRRQLAGVSSWTTEHARASEYSHIEWAHGPLHRSRQNAYLNWLQDQTPEIYERIFAVQPDADNTDIPDRQREGMTSIQDDLAFNTWLGLRTKAQLELLFDKQPFLGIMGFVVGEHMGGPPVGGSCCERLNVRALEQADKTLTEVMNYLDASNLSDNTLIVVTSARGSVQTALSDVPLQERAIKVPLMFKGPGITTDTIGSIVSTMDVAPTLYDLASISPPQRVQGRPLMSDHAQYRPKGSTLVRLRNPDHAWQTALCIKQSKLVMFHESAELERLPLYQLFDLSRDPDELNDLASSHAHAQQLEDMIDLMIDARVALEDRTEPRVASF